MSLRKKRRISKIQVEMERLQQELNMLMGLRFQRKRSLRAIGTTPAGTRPQGAPRCKGRIFGCLPSAAGPCECESACGSTNTKTDYGVGDVQYTICYTSKAWKAVILTVTLNLAAPANVVVMAAIVASGFAVGDWSIERPFGTDVTDQRATVLFGKSSVCGDSTPGLRHLEACETLPAGNYTWSLVNRSGATRSMFACWMKAREVTCTPV